MSVAPEDRTVTLPRGRRRELLEAAVHVAADQGLRGLTHRAVDRRAELPEGTCSAYLRTRQALLEALTDYVAVSVTADVNALAAELAELGYRTGTGGSLSAMQVKRLIVG